MRTLEVKANGKTAKGNKAITALYLLLTQGVSLGCLYTDVELPPEERITWRPIRKNGEVIGSVSWSYTDTEAGEIVRALELGASIQKKAKERRDVRIRVGA
ncbi:hypothetical protein [Desulfurobacterium crinifex]